ncbi:MAG: hypothetical protein V3W14_00930 [Candidatus Neomarinimicrobiota bacterium]
MPKAHYIRRISAASLVLLGGLLVPGRQLCAQVVDTTRIDSTHVDSTTVSLPAMFHSAPRAIPNNRSYLIEMFVSLQPEEIEDVHLLVRTDTATTFHEYPLEGEFGRYRHILTQEELGDTLLVYFFLLSRKDYGLIGYPRDREGGLCPFEVRVVEPTMEFFRGRRD